MKVKTTEFRNVGEQKNRRFVHTIPRICEYPSPYVQNIFSLLSLTGHALTDESNDGIVHFTTYVKTFLGKLFF